MRQPTLTFVSASRSDHERGHGHQPLLSLPSQQQHTSPSSEMPTTDSCPHIEPLSSSSSSSSSSPFQLFPVFSSGGAPSEADHQLSTATSSSSSTSFKRPGRQARSKAPVSYKEDLKAVLRADAVLEASIFGPKKPRSSSKRLAKSILPVNENSHDAASSPIYANQPKDEPQLTAQAIIPTEDDHGFEVVGSSLPPQPRQETTLSRNDQGFEVIEPFLPPLPAPTVQETPWSLFPAQLLLETTPSLSVKGTKTVSTSSKPHPFFSKRDKVSSKPPTLEVSNAAEVMSKVQPVKPKPSSSSWSLFASAPSKVSTLSKQKTPVNAAWPTFESLHARNRTEKEETLVQNLVTIPCNLKRKPKKDCQTLGQTDQHLSSVSMQQLLSARVESLATVSPQILLRPLLKIDTVDMFDKFIDQFVEPLSPLATSFATQRIKNQCRSRLVENLGSNDLASHLWSDFWRPDSANGCLGNETVANYLADWLKELLVRPPSCIAPLSGVASSSSNKRKAKRSKTQQDSSSSRRRIQTRVDRSAERRKAKASRKISGYESSGNDMADFIVDDSEEEQVWFDQFRSKSGENQDSDQDDQSSRDTPETVTVSNAPFPGLVRLPTPPLTGATTSFNVAHSAESPSQSTRRDDLQQVESDQPNFSQSTRLTNCIVVVGPSGSGKTAAVYACAAQLGYEVFELYPGMGKRSGKELVSTVGDLGRNHMVSSGGIGGGATWKRNLHESFKPHLSSNIHPTSPSDDAIHHETDSTNSVRQSLILIEEADVLYEQDKGFWSAVVELISESRRPIVIVCNDLRLIPITDLPVQEILEFHRPTKQITIPYLQLLAAATEGYGLSRNQIQTLFDLPNLEGRVIKNDGPIHPNTLSDLDKDVNIRVDLRKAIHQLQFWCHHHRVTTDHTVLDVEHNNVTQDSTEYNSLDVELILSVTIENVEPEQHLKALKKLASALDSLSLADVVSRLDQSDISQYGDPGIERQPELEFPSTITQLFLQPRNTSIHLPISSKDQSTEFEWTIQSMILDQFHVSLQVGIREKQIQSKQQFEYALARSNHCQEIETILRPLNIPIQSRLPRLEAILDYSPFVRNMIVHDDVQRTIHQENKNNILIPGSSRNTRNSCRFFNTTQTRSGQYLAWLPMMGPSEYLVARKTGFSDC